MKLKNYYEISGKRKKVCIHYEESKYLERNRKNELKTKKPIAWRQVRTRTISVDWAEYI